MWEERSHLVAVVEFEEVCEGYMRIFAGFLLDHDPALAAVADVERSHIEAFKLWQWAQPGISGRLKPATFRRRLGQLRTFFLRIIEWGWDDAPVRVPIFFGDVPNGGEGCGKNAIRGAMQARLDECLCSKPAR